MQDRKFSLIIMTLIFAILLDPKQINNAGSQTLKHCLFKMIIFPRVTSSKYINCILTRHGRDISRGIISRQKSGRDRGGLPDFSRNRDRDRGGLSKKSGRVGGIGILVERSRDKSG